VFWALKENPVSLVTTGFFLKDEIPLSWLN